MPAPTFKLTMRTPDGERIERETDTDSLIDAMAAYPGHSLISVYDLRPQVGLVAFADGSRYDARDKTGCYCPSDCACHHAHRLTVCGCTGSHA